MEILKNKKLYLIIKGFLKQKNVVSALIYRELKTRISLVKFGLFGVLLQPIGTFIIFLLIFGFIRRRGVGGLDVSFVPIFLISGIILYTLFFEIIIRSLNSIEANKALFFYRQVKPIDTILARVYVESGLFSFVFIILTSAIFLIFETFKLDDLPLIFANYVILALTGFGLGTFFMVAGHRYPFIKLVVTFLQRPLFLTSGIFFSLESIPQRFQPFLSWNPNLQAIEMTRHGFNKDYIINTDKISITYSLAFAIISCTLGLWVYSNNERILRTL